MNSTRLSQLLLLLFLSVSKLVAQEMVINGDGTPPDSSAMLDIQSSTKGLLIPRTDTSTVNNAGNSLANGLLIFQNIDNAFYYYNGSFWDRLSNPNQLNATIVDSDGNTSVKVEKNTNENQIRFEIDGQEKVIIDKFGNLGIGSNIISNTSTSSRVVELTGSAPQIILNDNSGSARDDFRILNGGANVRFQNFTSGDDIMTFGLTKDTNNVGIGTTSPSERLHIVGNLRIEDGSEKTGFILLSDSVGKATWQSPDSVGDDLGNHIANKLINTNSHWLSGDGDTEGLIITADGNLSILANGASNECGITQNSSVGESSSMEFTTSDANGDQASRLLLTGSSNNADIEFYKGAQGSEQLTMKIEGSNGKVQIGTTNSFGLLNVGTPADSYDYPNSFTNYMNSNVVSRTPTHSTAYQYSIWASNYVSGSGFHAHSDRRIKKVISLTNNSEDLEVLSKINITNYKMKDHLHYGNKVFKKVIAQDLFKVYPIAVENNTSEYIPNIYKVVDIQNGWINRIDSIQEGDKLKCFYGKKEIVATVLNIDGDKINLGYDITGQLFIYGKQVSNFHSVDYEAITMLNVSATQELIKQLNQMKEQIKQLQVELNISKASIKQ